MTYTLHHSQEGSQHTFHIQSEEAPATLTAQEVFDGKLFAVIDLQCSSPEDHKILAHLAKHLRQDPTFGKSEWMIQVRPQTDALLAAMMDAGWEVTKQKLLYRKALATSKPWKMSSTAFN